ncbi:stimulated by retinoic acid gene 8 protein homolog isoform X2 [Oxyura jamaicensis]|uniref:stimulated by retinoic acid gene 8 protein homolog isoform X2 n=1 Tax=Oxyura jamaicensis TaxID=8884 RepID=UPI0015A5F385|nr:stimulated by retinoic acid gene 8 protein homolog isoform X2 [Oxyura jamaicensis]
MGLTEHVNLEIFEMCMFKGIGHVFLTMPAINDEAMICSVEVTPVHVSVAESRTWQGLLLKPSSEGNGKVSCLKSADIQQDMLQAWDFWTCFKKGMIQTVAESFSLEEGNPSSLEEVKEEYVKRYFSNHSTASPSGAVSESDSTIWYLIQECEKQTMEEDGKPVFTQYAGASSPDLVEFERYLYVYKHTVDLLIEHGVVCTKEAPLPVVSMAISHLWQELSEERRDSILQYCSQRDFLLDPKAACQEPACTDGDVRDSQGNSEEASGSSVSTPEEVMFEDAFDVAAGFLDTNETQGMSSQSSAFASYTSENPEDDHRLYLQITEFLKSLFFANAQFCQEEDLQFDYETVMLRCTETFDDEDL